jgi:DNA repair protein RadC
MQVQKLPIHQWARDDQPREKLLSKNPVSLSDAELLAILIRTGTSDHSAVDLAREILKLGKNSLNELAKLPVRELMNIKGIGPAKAIAIAAALELGRRRQAPDSLNMGRKHKPMVRCSREVAAYLQGLLRDFNHEVFAVIFLNRGGRIAHFETVSQGGINGTVVDPRLILRQALQENAASLILCHNHPSGRLEPSQADKELTQKLKKASKYFDIKLLDHIIVSDEGYFSFADEGIL